MKYIHIKKIFDIFFGIVLLLIFFVPLVLISFLLLMEYRGIDVIFFQKRVGQGRKVFNLYKFKTMRETKGGDGKLIEDHLRTTKIGAFLRKSSIDELPQLINVIKGEMSIVGPRPLIERYLMLYSEEQNRRHQIRPGITGWAQVNGRNNISWAKKFELDVWYVDNQSFILDMKILWMTMIKVLTRKNITTDNPRDFQPFNGHN